MAGAEAAAPPTRRLPAPRRVPLGSTRPLAGIVLAAGGGRRFGGLKQLATFRGKPLVEWPLRALAEGGVERIILVLGAEAATVEAALDLERVETVRCGNWESGQANSLNAGLEAAAGAAAAVIVLGDQPLVTPAAVQRVVAAGHDATAARATYAGRPGHPVLIGRELWRRIAALEGDRGAGPLLEETGYVAVPCDDVGDPADVDTPDDLERLV